MSSNTKSQSNITQVQDVYDSFESKLIQDGSSFTKETIAELKREFLGKKGTVKVLLSKITEQPSSSKAEYGKDVNILKNYVENKITQLTQHASTAKVTTQIDPTAPFDINTPINQRPAPSQAKGYRTQLPKN